MSNFCANEEQLHVDIEERILIDTVLATKGGSSRAEDRKRRNKTKELHQTLGEGELLDMRIRYLDPADMNITQGAKSFAMSDIKYSDITLRKGTDNTLYDPLMGMYSGEGGQRDIECTFCMSSSCGGHAGLIKLPFWYFVPSTIGKMMDVLQCLCMRCGKIPFDYTNMKLRGTQSARLERINKVSSSTPSCGVCSRRDRGNCSTMKITSFIKESSSSTGVLTAKYGAEKDSRPVHYKADKIHELIHGSPYGSEEQYVGLTDEEARFMGFEDISHIESMMSMYVVVIPTQFRPLRYGGDGKLKHDEITSVLSDIIAMRNTYVNLFSKNNTILARTIDTVEREIAQLELDLKKEKENMEQIVNYEVSEGNSDAIAQVITRTKNNIDRLRQERAQMIAQKPLTAKSLVKARTKESQKLKSSAQAPMKMQTEIYEKIKKYHGMCYDFVSGKKGALRDMGLAKRGLQAARITVGPGTGVAIDEIEIPYYVASVLGREELVTTVNLSKIRRLHQRGRVNHINPVVEGFYPKGYVRAGSFRKITEDDVIDVGDEVIRCLTDGDIVVVVRMPTIHKYNMQAFKCKIVKSRSTAGMFFGWTSVYNMDYDGDEVSLWVPNNDDTVAEVIDRMYALKNIVSVRTGELNMGISLNALLTWYIATLPVTGEKDDKEKEVLIISKKEYDLSSWNKSVDKPNPDIEQQKQTLSQKLYGDGVPHYRGKSKYTIRELEAAHRGGITLSSSVTEEMERRKLNYELIYSLRHYLDAIVYTRAPAKVDLDGLDEYALTKKLYEVLKMSALLSDEMAELAEFEGTLEDAPYAKMVLTRRYTEVDQKYSPPDTVPSKLEKHVFQVLKLIEDSTKLLRYYHDPNYYKWAMEKVEKPLMELLSIVSAGEELPKWSLYSDIVRETSGTIGYLSPMCRSAVLKYIDHDVTEEDYKSVLKLREEEYQAGKLTGDDLKKFMEDSTFTDRQRELSRRLEGTYIPEYVSLREIFMSHRTKMNSYLYLPYKVYSKCIEDPISEEDYDLLSSRGDNPNRDDRMLFNKQVGDFALGVSEELIDVPVYSRISMDEFNTMICYRVEVEPKKEDKRDEDTEVSKYPNPPMDKSEFMQCIAQIGSMSSAAYNRVFSKGGEEFDDLCERYGVKRYSYRALFSALLPSDFSYPSYEGDPDKEVVIRNGMLMGKVPLDSNSLGTSVQSIPYAIYSSYGVSVFVDFIQNCYIIGNYMTSIGRGLSIGLRECTGYASTSEKEKIKKRIEESLMRIEIEESKTIDRSKKLTDLQETSLIDARAQMFTQIANEVIDMEKKLANESLLATKDIGSGSKGGKENLSQMLIGVGQMKIGTGGMPYNLGVEGQMRSTGADYVGEYRSTHSGFIQNGLIDGLTTSEALVKARGDRGPVTDIAIQTPVSGSMARLMGITMMSLMTMEQGGVKSGNGLIYQTIYGGDNFDITNMKATRGNYLPFDPFDLANKINAKEGWYNIPGRGWERNVN